MGPGKTEAVLARRGPGAKGLTLEIMNFGGILAGEVTVRVVPAYKHLGTLVTSTACPTQDAARRANLDTIAYSRVSGHFLSSRQFDMCFKLQATAAFVDATLLHGSELWAPLAEGIAARIEAVHMHWFRKATGEFRVVKEGRLSDADVRITHEIPQRTP